GKILTRVYLYVTQPQALGHLLQLTRHHIEIMLGGSEGISCHPKAYIFKHREDGAIIIGSSNLSRSALTIGVEWDLRMVRNATHNVFDQSIEQFISMFYSDQTIAINTETIKLYENDYNNFHDQHA